MSNQYPAKFKADALKAREIQLIHVARQKVGMDDDTYRALLQDRFAVASSKEMDGKQRAALLTHFKTLGFVVVSKKSPQTRKLADDPQSKLIRSLWLQLHEVGKVHNPAESALAAFVKRQTKIDALQWLTSRQASSVIEELKKWLTR